MVFSVEKIVNAFVIIGLGFALGLSGGWILWGKNVFDYGKANSSLRAELESADQALIRSQARVIDSKRAVDRGRTGIVDSLGKLESVGQGLDGIEELAQSSLGILGEIRKSPILE